MKKNGFVILSHKIKFVEGNKIKKKLLFGLIRDIVVSTGVIFAFVIGALFFIKSKNSTFIYSLNFNKI